MIGSLYQYNMLKCVLETDYLLLSDRIKAVQWPYKGRLKAVQRPYKGRKEAVKRPYRGHIEAI